MMHEDRTCRRQRIRGPNPGHPPIGSNLGYPPIIPLAALPTFDVWRVTPRHPLRPGSVHALAKSHGGHHFDGRALPTVRDARRTAASNHGMRIPIQEGTNEARNDRKPGAVTGIVCARSLFGRRRATRILGTAARRSGTGRAAFRTCTCAFTVARAVGRTGSRNAARHTRGCSSIHTGACSGARTGVSNATCARERGGSRHRHRQRRAGL